MSAPRLPSPHPPVSVVQTAPPVRTTVLRLYVLNGVGLVDAVLRYAAHHVVPVISGSAGRHAVDQRQLATLWRVTCTPCRKVAEHAWCDAQEHEAAQAGYFAANSECHRAATKSTSATRLTRNSFRLELDQGGCTERPGSLETLSASGLSGCTLGIQGTPRNISDNIKCGRRQRSYMPRKRKADSVLRQFAATLGNLATERPKPSRILVDTGPSKPGYRVAADLKRKTCPRCKCIHYSSWHHEFCIECYAYTVEERRLGRRLTKEEEQQVLRDVGLLD